METAIKDSIELRGKQNPKTGTAVETMITMSQIAILKINTAETVGERAISNEYVAPSLSTHLPQPRTVHLRRKRETCIMSKMKVIVMIPLHPYRAP